MSQSPASSASNAWPPNGVLSGMILTVISAVFWLSAPFFSSEIARRFQPMLSQDLRFWFNWSVFVMAIHKLESYLLGEHEECPVYLHQATRKISADPKRLNFVVFVGTFLAMLFLCMLLLNGAPWHQAVIGIWVGQGFHELHHTAKSAARKQLYPGAVSSVVFVYLVLFAILPAWVHGVLPELEPALRFVPAIGACIWSAFYIEDRAWIKKLGFIPRAARKRSFPENTLATQ